MQQNASSNSNKAVIEFLTKHPSPKEWDVEFGAQAQVTLTNPSIALGAIDALSADQCPTLTLFYESYQEMALQWMETHIEMLNATAQVGARLDAWQRRLLAQDIFSTFGGMNLGEICVFFGRVRQGMYGQFYGAVDGMLIMKWLHQFRDELNAEIIRYQDALAKQRREREKKEWARTSITREEWEKTDLYKQVQERIKKEAEERAKKSAEEANTAADAAGTEAERQERKDARAPT